MGQGLGFVTAILLYVPLAAHAADASDNWVGNEFIGSWATPDSGLEHFLNSQCRPSSIDGIQIFAVQTGHQDKFHLHVFCRPDADHGVRYRVTMPPVARGTIDSVVAAALKAQPDSRKLRVGPFWFGEDGQADGIMLIERLQ